MIVREQEFDQATNLLLALSELAIALTRDIDEVVEEFTVKVNRNFNGEGGVRLQVYDKRGKDPYQWVQKYGAPR